ncbi:F-box protein [Camellia lanceoleosa]|uniref:F-box protein n=1 Tax=Camellia lanceoleosa TaxID=1840588 RepID=A0ACC0GXR5_9ERIC|nr:F-box protein [Camellia lanceoleosa]
MDLASEKHSKKRKGKLEDDQRRIGMESLPPDIALDVLSRLPITSLLQFSKKHSKKRKCKLEDDQPRSGMESIQPDIPRDIFSRLPIASLLQFSFVSRFWHMLSYDPHLAALHFSRTTKKNTCLISHCDYPIRNQLCFVKLSDQMDNEIVRRIQTPFRDAMPEFNVIASCNGLLCLSDSLYDDPVCIYNPFPRVYKELPKSRQFDDQVVVFGFGFHPVTNKYEVVKITLYWNQYTVFLRSRTPRSEVHVYSLGSNNWRSVGKVLTSLNGEHWKLW